MEVSVEFLDDDPDQPIVTGGVQNGRYEVPGDLSEHEKRSTFKSKSHEGEGFGEVRFAGKAGEEEILVHAEKDRNTKVKNNQSERANMWMIRNRRTLSDDQVFGPSREQNCPTFDRSR